jgi:hypothetical protein
VSGIYAEAKIGVVLTLSGHIADDLKLTPIRTNSQVFSQFSALPPNVQLS